MSADNYWLIRQHPSGSGYTYLMGFASDEGHPICRKDREYPKFSALDNAVQAAADDSWTEYGIQIHEECRA